MLLVGCFYARWTVVLIFLRKALLAVEDRRLKLVFHFFICGLNSGNPMPILSVKISCYEMFSIFSGLPFWSSARTVVPSGVLGLPEQLASRGGSMLLSPPNEMNGKTSKGKHLHFTR